MSEPLYKIEKITKSYSKGGETLTILDQLDLTIDKGDFISVMGPSGTGKSTLFNILGGLDSIDEGNVVFQGKDISKLSSKSADRWRSQHVGFIFQFYHLIPILTTYQNVALPLLLTPLPKSKHKKMVQTALELVGLKDREKHYPNQLSGGQQQRVAIARAIVKGPSVILADELTGDLDTATAEEIGKIIKRVNKDRETTIVSFTHDRKIADLGNHVLTMDKGKIVPLS